jgi:GH15 family glucan-1,4-alpha-glucosidase
MAAGAIPNRRGEPVALPIEDYALIGDGHTAALVGRDGSIDWLCLPRFDSGACVAALLGSHEHGRWLIAPRDGVNEVRRRYRDGTLILETDFETESGAVRVIDCMPLSNERWDVLRIVEGLRGRVRMHMELVIRFDYGSIVPWVRRANGTLFATAGPDTLELHTPVPTRGEHMTSRADFEVGIGERVPFMLNYRPSYTPAQEPIDADETLASTEQNWLAWSQRCRCRGRWQAPVLRSLLTLKALIYGPPAESSPRRQPRCPSSPAACATGTTATAGCATRPSRSTPCCWPDTTRRRRPGGIGWCAPSRAVRLTCSSYTA